MNILSKEDFLSKKTSDTIVVYGSGYSINKIKDDQLQKLSQYDSITFNWFCKSKIPVTFYVVREQANMRKRISQGENRKIFFQSLNEEPYKDSTLIVHDLSVSRHRNRVFSYHTALEKFSHDGIVVNDIKLDMNDSGINKWRKTSIMDDGVIHGKMSLNGVLHIVINMGYKKVLFAGVDLNDSRYFWLGNETRHTVKSKGQNAKSRHILAKDTLELLIDVKKHWGIEMATVSSKSLLKKIMRVWK